MVMDIAILKWALFGGFFSLATNVCAEDRETNLEPLVQKFYVKPNKCIALHKGQLCYQKVRFNWQTLTQQEFCIVRSSDEKAIVCWQGDEKQNHEFKFSAAETETFELREKGSNSSLAEVKIQVAWVYRKSKKSSTGWRLF